MIDGETPPLLSFVRSSVFFFLGGEIVLLHSLEFPFVLETSLFPFGSVGDPCSEDLSVFPSLLKIFFPLSLLELAIFFPYG